LRKPLSVWKCRGRKESVEFKKIKIKNGTADELDVAMVGTAPTE
jgi:hypothetical protein